MPPVRSVDRSVVRRGRWWLGALASPQVKPAGTGHVGADEKDQPAGHVGRRGEEPVRARKPPGGEADSKRSGQAGRGQRRREADREGRDQVDAEQPLPDPEAEQQHRDCGGAGDQPAYQPETDRLRTGRPAAGEAGLDLAGMGVAAMIAMVARPAAAD